VRPSSILALTFTNKAAAEMRTRVADTVQREPTHAFCPPPPHARSTKQTLAARSQPHRRGPLCYA
jgi:superfamily I DNA/RNA helicase